MSTPTPLAPRPHKLDITVTRRAGDSTHGPVYANVAFWSGSLTPDEAVAVLDYIARLQQRDAKPKAGQEVKP